MSEERKERGGLAYSPDGHVIGKGRFRIRHSHLRDHIAPLITDRKLGAAKLDLVLRGLAFHAEHLGNRKAKAGLVLSRYRYEDLHDLCRPHTYYRGRQEFEAISLADELARKSEWVRMQLLVLEDKKLVQRVLDPRGGRPTLYVLSDRGNDQPYDDPGSDPPFITLHGAIIACGAFAEWGTREVVAYLAALVAERFDPSVNFAEPGAGNWWRPPSWFADTDKARPNHHIRIPFNKTTLKRGLQALRDDGWIKAVSMTRNPKTGRRLPRPRNFYTNRFEARANVSSDLSISIEQFLDSEPEINV